MKTTKIGKTSVFYINKNRKITEAESFRDASKEELRVLIAIAESSGENLPLSLIAKKALVTEARAKAAVTLWLAEEILTEAGEDEHPQADNITHEFKERFSSSMYEESAKESAKTIRDGELASLISECALLMNKPALTTEEIKKIASIYSQLSLSEEYIFTLAAHLAEKKKLTATLLAKQAERLVSRGVDTLESLCLYIDEEEKENSSDKEFRRLFGIWNRNLSDSERRYFKKWSEEFGFSVEIVGEAYNIMTTNNSSSSVSLPYIDKILESWHSAGCTTVAMCKAHSEATKNLSRQKANASQKKKEEKKPKFINFDVSDAFKKALERSYGTDKNDN